MFGVMLKASWVWGSDSSEFPSRSRFSGSVIKPFLMYSQYNRDLSFRLDMKVKKM